jgi:hypothetical protein
MTSLTSQLRHDDFGKLFARRDGTHPQVFDTGERFSDEAAASLRERLDRVALPFRLGLGAFERVSGERAPTTAVGGKSSHSGNERLLPRTLDLSRRTTWNLNASKGIFMKKPIAALLAAAVPWPPLSPFLMSAPAAGRPSISSTRP